MSIIPYENHGYSSSEAKRLLSLLLEDNSHLKNTGGSEERKFLRSLGLSDNAPEVPKDDFTGTTITIDKDRGVSLGQVALSSSFELSTEPAAPRRGTLMHTWNANALKGALSPEAQKNADFLDNLSGYVRNRTQFDSLKSLLDRACPSWNDPAPVAELTGPASEQQAPLLSQERPTKSSYDVLGIPRITRNKDGRHL